MKPLIKITIPAWYKKDNFEWLTLATIIQIISPKIGTIQT
jgi:hypothetical protein